MRAGYLTFALAALGLCLVGVVAATPVPPQATVSAALGLDGPDPVELDRRRALAVAAGTAACMRALGFAYDPVPEPVVVIPDATLDPIAWAARWGFGVTTSLGSLPPDPIPDVNAARAARLPVGVREPYLRALHGDGAEPGCLAAATTAVYGLRERALAPIQPLLVALDRAIDADPAMDGVRRRWVDCVGPAIAPLGSPTLALERTRLPAGLLGWFASRGRAVRTDHDLANAQALERWVAVAIARCEATFVSSRARVAGPHEAAFLEVYGVTVQRIGAAIRALEDHLPSSPSAARPLPLADR